MTATCKGCGQRNRIPKDMPAPHPGPAGGRVRCGRCKREFTAVDLMEASIAETLGGLGATGVEWVDEDGTRRGGFDFPPESVKGRKP